ncbi:hypothetical protein [Streptomyces hebeiensis]
MNVQRKLMARKSKHKNDLDRLAKLSAKLGIDVDALLEQVSLTDVGHDAVVRKQLEAESVLYYVETKGKNFSARKCKGCGEDFLFTHFRVSYCSENCRAQALADLGIIWNPHRKSDGSRWNIKGKGLIPKVISSSATAALVESGNIHTEFPETIEDDFEDEEISDSDPSSYIGSPPEGSKFPVDEYEKQQRIQEVAKRMVESGEFEDEY